MPPPFLMSLRMSLRIFFAMALFFSLISLASGIRLRSAAKAAPGAYVAKGLAAARPVVKDTATMRPLVIGFATMSAESINTAGVTTVLATRDPWQSGRTSLHMISFENRPSNDTQHKYGKDGPRPKNLGEGQSWSGYRTKVDVIQKWLHSEDKPADDDIVFFLDGDTAWGTCDEETFMARYKAIVDSSRAKIVFGADMSSFEVVAHHCTGADPNQIGSYIRPQPTYPNQIPDGGASIGVPEVPTAGPQKPLVNWAKYAHPNFTLDCAYYGGMRGLNSGFIMGPAAELRKMYDEVESYYDLGKVWGSDQNAFWQYFLKHPRDVTLDYAARLVLDLGGLNSSVFSAEELFPLCALHGNGPAKDLLGSWVKQHKR